MTIEQDIQLIIKRIEAADAVQADGGYALDGEIAKLIGWTYRYRDVTHSWGWSRPGNTTHFDARPPAYTSSIDAAMSLVPTEPYPELRPGQWWWMIEAWPNEKTAHVAYENGDSGIPEFSGKGATPALALCAAALRARRGE